MRFSYKIIGSVGILILVSLSGLSFMQYNMVKDKVTEQINHSISDVTTSVASDLEHVLQSKVKIVELVVQTMQDDYMPSSIQKLLNKPLLKQEFVTSALGYKRGLVVHNDPSWHVGSDYNPSSRPWFIKASQAGRTVFTDPYVDSDTHELLVSIASPNYTKSHSLLGVSFFDLKLSFLNEITSQVEIADGAGKVFIVTNEGKIVSHINESYNGKMLREIAPTLNLNQAQEIVTINGTKFLAGFLDLEGVDWKVGYYVDINQAYKSVADLRARSLYMGIGALVLSLIIMGLITHALMRPVKNLDDAIDNLNGGDADLTQRLDTNSDYEFAQISEKFNTFIAMLQQQMKETQTSSEEIKENSNETAKFAAEAQGALDVQGNELEQLVTAMEEMSSTAAEVASNAQQAADATIVAQQATDEGNTTVENSTEIIRKLAEQINTAITVVDELAASTVDIGTILGVITEISEQTNLLALNAAIEAARAGEQGRGFAVVADEVRTLAQRTQESTNEIGEMITVLQGKSKAVVQIMDRSKAHVTDTVSVADESNLALNKIAEAINRANDMIVQIASAAEEQSSVSVEINGNANNISTIAEKVVTLMHDTNDLAAQQLTYVEKQEQLTHRFKV